MTLKLDAARNFLTTSPDRADALIADLKQQAMEMIRDIRTLVYELRPPALDELGLVGAIQNYIEGNTSAEPEIKFDAPDQLPVIAAAIEVAVYRTIMEGITNILKHAGAKSALIRIRQQDDDLILEISDDGIGLPEERTTGVGMASMRERADELGGSFSVLPSERGLHLHISFPLEMEEKA